MYTQHLGQLSATPWGIAEAAAVFLQTSAASSIAIPIASGSCGNPIDVFASDDEVGALGEETIGQGEGIMAQGELDEGGLEDGECRYCLGQEHDSLEIPQQEGSEWPPGWESDNE